MMARKYALLKVIHILDGLVSTLLPSIIFCSFKLDKPCHHFRGVFIYLLFYTHYCIFNANSVNSAQMIHEE